jgi:hypothetical protein
MQKKKIKQEARKENNMQLNELTPSTYKQIQNFPNSVPIQRLIKFLMEKGYHKISSGHFSTVYGHNDTNVVIKINEIRDNAYNSFIRYTREHPNKHWPKTLPPKKWSDKWIYVLEKLKPLQDVFSNDESTKIGMLLAYLNNLLEQRYLFKELIPAFNMMGVNLRLDLHKYEIRSLLPCILAFRRFKSPNHYWDIKFENLMFREKTKTIVVTDPTWSDWN